MIPKRNQCIGVNYQIQSPEKQLPNYQNMNQQQENQDELIQKLNTIAQKFKEDIIEFSYFFNDQWIEQNVEKVQITQNFEMLTFHIRGSDPFGAWIQVGVITINKIQSQVETFSRKIYDDSFLQGGDILIYHGSFNEENQQFEGAWQYQQDQSRGDWKIRFKEQ
ncbi:unnamed protein product [Paramecium sonneborni]|uniref:Uncharacterized protein n=1 Tax=Paramecium sonneborni TaxID=65129 RepID=A0A8S1PAQ3_9CILI|nr:unnamed protein product [Paramecium sonneborni]